MANKSSCLARIVIVLVLLIGALGLRAQSPREMEIEKVLNKHNKPPIKTIEEELINIVYLHISNGDIIDCANIYEQPAFDHPLLKNHTIKVNPSFSPEIIESGIGMTSFNMFHLMSTLQGSFYVLNAIFWLSYAKVCSVLLKLLVAIFG